MAQREKVRLGISNLRQRGRVKESPEQRKTRLAAQRERTRLRISILRQRGRVEDTKNLKNLKST